MKHKSWMKYEKFIVSVSYFVVRIVKTLTKYLWNLKYKSV